MRSPPCLCVPHIAARQRGPHFDEKRVRPFNVGALTEQSSGPPPPPPPSQAETECCEETEDKEVVRQ
jgi:hypothetical protein